MNWADLKVNPVTAALYRAVLGRRCRSVESYIFVATTGRSGSMSLRMILEAVSGCTAVHEPYPDLMGPVLVAYNDGDERPLRREFKLRKVPNIYRAAAGHRWYAETNHGFIKCFCGVAAEYFGARMQVVHMVREPAAVARSLLLRKTVPGRTRSGREYLIDPAAPRNAVQISDVLGDGARFAHDYFRCLWYWYEIEARYRRFRRAHPEVRTHDIETEGLNDRNRVAELLTGLGMPADPDVLAKTVGVRANVSEVSPPAPEGVSEADIAAFTELCEAKLEAAAGTPADRD
ncbi:MAG: hypothetical protein R6V58_08300 [Planctomycetota bacterium]